MIHPMKMKYYLQGESKANQANLLNFIIDPSLRESRKIKQNLLNMLKKCRKKSKNVKLSILILIHHKLLFSFKIFSAQEVKISKSFKLTTLC
jgi:hypothetical protein